MGCCKKNDVATADAHKTSDLLHLNSLYFRNMSTDYFTNIVYL